MKFLSNPKFLAIYSGTLTVVFAASVLMGATQVATHKTKFEEIDVQRINVVEPDGTLRLVVSNTARAPGIVFRGKEHPHPGGRRTAGLVFFNDEGTENGGLIFDGAKDQNGNTSTGHLSFDNYEQDQTMVLEANQAGDRKQSFLRIMDRPNWSLLELFDLFEKNKNLSKEQQQASLDKFLKEHPAAQTRVFLGRGLDQSAALNLKDTAGRDRIVIKVAADGTPSLQFLDADGKVTSQLPPPAKG